MKQYKLLNTKPPKKWVESLPMGCGKLGAAFMCGVAEETVYLNEETVWSQNKNIFEDEKMPEKIKKIRELFLNEGPVAANNYAATALSGSYNRICSYESAGKMKLELHDTDACSNYSHSLDLINGIATVQYDKGGSHYTREYFASYPDKVIVCHVTSSNKELCACVGYERECMVSQTSADGVLTAVAHTVFGGHRFCVKAKAVTDGAVDCVNGQLLISGTKSFTLYISIETEFRHGEGFTDAYTFPTELDYEKIKARHIADFSALMSRADVTLPSVPELEELSIDEKRRVMWYNKPKDESRFALQWQFGRYLLCSTSRNGTLPANLQGLWTEGLASGWSCDYHTNINIQANYWAAETVNLSDCHMPLFDYMNDYLLEAGKNAAKKCYGTRGCVVHHLSDIYGFGSPADGPWGLWPHGASWLTLHMWEHYLFTKDEAFLREKAYPFIREAAVFFLDNLVEDKNGQLHYAPSTSPENPYFAEDANGKKQRCYLAMSSTMDVEIITTLFHIFLETVKVLGISDPDAEGVALAKSKLPQLRVGKFGQLMEWIEEYEETDPGHRHTSHSFGLFPSFIINRSTPETYNAIAATIDRRLAHAGSAMQASSIGWSLAWLGSANARLRRASKAYAMVNSFVSGVSTNLWDIIDIPHFGEKTFFQIDGNLGFVCAMSEMLIQSHEGVIAVLPALPPQWHSGSFRGLCARGGYEVSAGWKDMRIETLEIKAKFPGEYTVEVPALQKDAVFADENGNLYKAEESLLHLNVTSNITLHAVGA